MVQQTMPVAEKRREVAQGATETPRIAQAEDISRSGPARSDEADRLRAEIIAVGQKLWERSYVDGNGGNISVRLGAHSVLCTPTMMSKRDIQPADICLCDLEGNMLAGSGHAPVNFFCISQSTRPIHVLKLSSTAIRHMPRPSQSPAQLLLSA